MTNAVTSDSIRRGLELALRPCILCGGHEFETLARVDRNLIGITTAGCKRCGLVQTNPRPSEPALARFYREHYRQFYQGATSPDSAYVSKLRKDVRLSYTVEHLAHHFSLSKDATVLDYGCGEGSLFAALRQTGFVGSFYGVEPNAPFARYASEQGRAQVSNTIADAKPANLITVNHVLEHLARPRETLAELRALLLEGGHLYIDVPDVDAYAKIADLHIAHILHFSARTLRELVESAGFIVLDVQQHRPPHHPPSIRLSARGGASGLTHAVSTTPETERTAWRAVRAAGRRRHEAALRVRLRLQKLGPPWRAARRTIHALLSRSHPE